MVPAVLLGLIFSIGALHYGGLFFGWYHDLWWFDIPLHMLGGMFVGTLFVYLFRQRFLILHELSFLPLLVLGVGSVASVGIVWEWYEFLADVYLLRAYTPLAYPGHIHFDTLLDLLNGMVGGAIAILLLRNAAKR